MATLVLTAVGTVLGGPIGAAVGAIAGQAIDAELFKPAGRKGPRLSDLRVQTSSYGTAVPMIFGTMRVAGTVIWATDLVERRERSGGGKGRPKVTTYSYSASFAVAVSSRPITGIGRIWADGNLLRGSGGDFKASLGAFRVHSGAPDQAPDPLISADKGADTTPAHRDTAYVVFDDLELADFGNRIPSLTFEVVSDTMPSIGAVARALTGMAAIGPDEAEALSISGYAALGEDAAAALAPLIEAQDLLALSEGGGVVLTGGRASGEILGRREDLRAAGGKRAAAREERREPIERVPRRVSLRHYEPGRDFQTGMQRAERQGAGASEALVDLPAAMAAEDARRGAVEGLRRMIARRRTVRVARGWAALTYRVGDIVTLEGAGGRFRIETLEWEAGAVQLALQAVPSSSAVPSSPADAGEAVRQADMLAGPTHLAVIEMPQPGEEPVGVPQILVAACGGDAGWRPAALLQRDDEDAYVPIGRSAPAAVLGEAIGALLPGPAALFDDRASVQVRLFDDSAILSPASDAALLNGANACMIGDELLQFGEAIALGGREYLLRRLLRGRRGSEWASLSHAAGETFVLIEEDRLFPLSGDIVRAGATITVAAQGLGDLSPVLRSRTVTGVAALPLSPVRLQVQGSDADGYAVRWVRRSRAGWQWRDGIDAPLGEEQERYVVTLSAGGTALRSAMLVEPLWTLPPASIASDRMTAAGAPIAVSVSQVGDHGQGQAATVWLPAG